MEGVSEPSKKTPARPTQVTVAAWMIMVGSIFVVLLVWDRIAGLHSLDTRKALEPLLDDQRLKDAGIQMNDLLVVIRVVSMVAAGCAAAMVVLGYQTLQRSRGARLALTVLAVPLFVSGLATGGYVSSAVAAAVGTLWLGPARLWFDGKVAASGAQAATHPATRPVWPPPYDPGPSAQPGPTQPGSTAARPPTARPPTARAAATAAPLAGRPAAGVGTAPDLAVRRARGRSAERRPDGRPGRPADRPGLGLRAHLDLHLAGSDGVRHLDRRARPQTPTWCSTRCTSRTPTWPRRA